MTRSGGSVALNGFLYQILRHLDWSADVSLTGTLDGQEVKDGCIVLEPAKGGGDAQAHASGLYLVEQYKTRASGTWSLSDVIAVLRDLRKSVPERFAAFATKNLVGHLHRDLILRTPGRPSDQSQRLRFRPFTPLHRPGRSGARPDGPEMSSSLKP